MALDSQTYLEIAPADSVGNSVPPLAQSVVPSAQSAVPAEQSVVQLDQMLRDITAASPAPEAARTAYENHLAAVRLGIAAGLFHAIRHKHAPTAAHSLRVALGCSSWAFAMGLKAEERDELEVAALLHDIGKIGVPDRVLFKPGALGRDEVRLVDQYRRSGIQIVAGCCDRPGILDAIRYSGGWYNGTRSEYALSGTDIPLGARMLSIVDAFDSMTSDQVFRRAMSRERALHELFRHAGVQFDPELVRAYADLQVTVQLNRRILGHWLESLDAGQANRFWQGIAAGQQAGGAVAPSRDEVFQRKLLESMHDAVIFVNNSMQIILWNRAAERLTGIAAASVIDRTWSPTLIGMRDEGLGGWSRFECPAAYAMTSGVQSIRRLLVANRNNKPIAVDVHTVPVVGSDGQTHGAAMLLHDASGEASLEERCQSLQETASKDPLTEVANRAEFERSHKLFVNEHLERGVPCSTIICDVDRFKSINDTYGHQAGDEVLRSFGQLLKRECRPGDLVARYGGEEFVVLCSNCTNAAAARRAEELRKMIAQHPQAALGGKEITVSFGVTEIQPGDTPESMLRRADRALLEAKRLGRNMVMQLGNGLPSEATEEPAVQHAPGGELFVERLLVSAVPLNIAIEKLRGFVLDHDAEILAINADRIDLQIQTCTQELARRRSDQPLAFLVELTFSERHVPTTSVDGRATGEVARTQIKVSIRLKRARDRNVADVADQASAILAGIRSYLMASNATHTADGGRSRRTVNLLAPWLDLRR